MKVHIHLFHRALGIVALAFGTLLLSCTQEIPVDYPDNDGVEMVINVGNDTRTTNNGDQTLWDAEDVLTVIHTSDGTEFWASAFQNTGGNAFTGKVKRLSATNDWYVIYPYLEENVAANQISFTFPSSQAQNGNGSMAHLAGEQFPLFGKKTGVARSEALSMPVQNLLAVAGFKVKNDLKDSDRSIIVKEVQFTAPTPVSGAFSVDLTGSNPVLTAGSGATKTVKLAVNNGSAIEKGAESWFYVAVAPFEAPVGSKIQLKTVAVYADDPTTQVVFYRTIDVEQATSFNSGVIKTVNVPFDEKNSTNPDAGTGTEVELEEGEEPEDGVYLLVYKNGETSMAFAAFDEYKSQNYAIPVTVVDNQVLPQEDIDLSRFEITIEKAGLVHPNDAGHDAYNVKNSEGKFIFYASGGSGDAILRIQDTNTLSNSSSGNVVSYYHTFVQAEDGVQILSSGSESGYNKYLLAYSAANGFYYEQNNTGQKLHLYILGGSAKEKQTLVFTPDNVPYDFDAGGDFPEPTLEGYHTALTWSSNNEAVATVDENGNVIIHAAGNAKITVKAEADGIYYAATASYTIESTSSSVQTWYKADQIEAGKQYLIVSNGYALQNNNGSTASLAVTVSNDVITLDNVPATILWTATASSGKFTFNNDGRYIQRGGSSSSYTLSLSTSPSSYYQWSYDSSNSYLTASGNSTYYTYYSSSKWIMSKTAGNTALYSSTKPLTPQTISFANPTVTKVLGEGFELGDTFGVQLVSNAQTSVTYESLNESVATVDGETITVVAKGTATIKATAHEENGYKEATATYTLRIREPVTGDFVELEGSPFNLENDNVRRYLDDAEASYNDTNYKGSDKITVVSNYTSGSGRKDIPKPVTIDWGSPCSGTATITILANDKATEVWSQTATDESTSSDVYNLIPGEEYYCTVTDDTGVILRGYFETIGRRRMILVSTTQSQDHGNNCRDLGGLKTTDGRRIKYGMIFRGTNLDGTKQTQNGVAVDVPINNYVAPNDSEQGLLANYLNIGYDIDLRAGGKEAFLSKYDVKYVLGNMQPSLGDVSSTDKATTTIQGFFAAAAAGKASYFHCAIGSDRTGFWGLLIEGLLGVSVKDCSIDFELTSFYNTRERTNANLLFYQGMENTSGSFKGFANYEGATFQEKVAKYVKSLGFTDEQITAFRNNVLEDDPDL